MRVARRMRGEARLPARARLALLLCGSLLPSLALCGSTAQALPDNRGYELVTRYEEGGREVGLNGVEALFGLPSVNGEAFDWEDLFGGCCGATSAGFNLYQSARGEHGWQTRVLTPTPPSGEPLDGFLEEQGPIFWTADLKQTIWTTPSSFDPGDHRPPGSNVQDLYLQGPSGAMTWITQGPLGTGTAHDSAEFDGATPDAAKVVFSSAEPLTANATPLESLPQRPQYLYVRDVAGETTSLVDVNTAGALISPYGASLGNAGYLRESLTTTNSEGTSTHAISANGEKIFFETPPPGAGDLPPGEVPHLYMRNLADGTTTPLDDPSSAGSARYESASTDGSLVFFTSDEGLDGASTAKELYVFNTTAEPIGSVPPMGSQPVAGGIAGVLGVGAIANDGSRVFFVAESLLASNANPAGRTATANQPNLYAYDIRSGHTTFITTLALPDINNCKPTCGSGKLGGVLLSELDLERTIYPTPDGSVLVFESFGALTGPSASPATTLTTEASAGEHTIEVASTAGFGPKQAITIGEGGEEEIATVESVDGPTQLTLSEGGLASSHSAVAPVAELNGNVYRYDFSENSLTCVSCTPAGVTPTGSATMGYGGGGSYAPPQQPVPLSEDGSRIFFTSPDPLAPGANKASTGEGLEPTNVYEWEHGAVSLISDGTSIGSFLDGATPSGNDVFFTSRAHLIPGAVSGDEYIYDARVGGGFPLPHPAPPCTGQDCRAQAGPTVFFSVPASSILTGSDNFGPPGAATPSFSVAKITPAQRAKLVRSGRLELTVDTTGAGHLDAEVSARIGGRAQRVAHTSATLAAAGHVRLRLDLSAAARRTLARNRSLGLRLEVSYSASRIVKIAELKLTSGGHGAGRATGRRGTHA